MNQLVMHIPQFADDLIISGPFEHPDISGMVTGDVILIEGSQPIKVTSLEHRTKEDGVHLVVLSGVIATNRDLHFMTGSYLVDREHFQHTLQTLPD